MSHRRSLTHTGRSALQTLMRRFGVKVTRLPEHHSHQYWIREVIEGEGVNLLIDVGACVGEFVAEVRALGYQGHALLVEPGRANFEQLVARFAPETATTVRHVALGSEPRTVELLTYPTKPYLNSIRGFSSQGRAHFDNPVPQVERVPMERLDDLLQREGLDTETARVFLKVDTQGSDWEVITGAPNTMHAVRSLHVEIAAQQLYEDTAPLHEQLKRLMDLGFAIVSFAPVARSGATLLEFDCLLTRDPGRVGAGLHLPPRG